LARHFEKLICDVPALKVRFVVSAVVNVPLPLKVIVLEPRINALTLVLLEKQFPAVTLKFLVLNVPLVTVRELLPMFNASAS
jgi:hypothetical protein